jgi:hypothetical protein
VIHGAKSGKKLGTACKQDGGVKQILNLIVQGMITLKLI